MIDYVYPGIPNKKIDITGNTKDTLYVIIVCYAGGGSDTALSRTPITACTGADYELIAQHKNPQNTGYAFALYRLTNAESSISISALATNYGGNFIVLG